MCYIVPVLAVPLALAPVTVFLGVLLLLDSFKLVPRRTLLRALAGGALAAVSGAALHTRLVDRLGVDPRPFSRYVAPITEETLKTACLLLFVRRHHVGFLVDAGILGFAVGTGFALVENLAYLRALPHGDTLVWVVRGFGTAFLHGATTSLVSVSAKSIRDQSPQLGVLSVLPGWSIAVILHSAFNHAVVSPVIAAAVLLSVLPLAAMAVFQRSEAATREWIGTGMDRDVELLKLVTSQEFGRTRLGAYLRELTSRFPGPVVADMFCLLRIQLELAIRARGVLMAHEAGLELPADEQTRARLDELRFLERSIGPTGLLALRPLRASDARSAWHRYLLGHTSRST